jgi:tetratricopeptide (TPR) repeat protein
MVEPVSLPQDKTVNSQDRLPDSQESGPRHVETKAGNREAEGQAHSILSVLDQGRKFILNSVILLALALGISVIGKATVNRGVLIEPISVPKDLAERGLTPEAAAHFIVDEMVILSDSANTLKRFDMVGTSGPQLEKPKIEVPGTGISIDTIVYYLRDFLGRSDTKISGEIVVDRQAADPPPDKSRNDSTSGKNRDTPSQKYNLRLRIASRGFVYVESESTDDLHVLFKRAAMPLLEQINPYIAGIAYLNQKDFIRATRMAEIELRAGSDDNKMWAMNLLGAIAKDQNRTSAAIAQYKKLKETFPDFPMGHYNLGHTLFNEKDYQDSIHASLEGARIDPDSRSKAIGYGNAGSAFNEMRKNRVEFDTRNDNADGILRTLGKVVKDKAILATLRRGQVPTSDLAIELFKAATDANPIFASAYLAWGRIENEKKNFTEATALFEKSIAAEPRKPFAYRDMGSLYNAQGDWENAARFFREAVALNPTSYFDHYGLGRALGELRKYEEAIAELQAALKLNPKYPWSHLRWAETLVRRLDEENGSAAETTKAKAVEHLKSVLEIAPNDRNLITQVSLSYEALGMIEESAAVYGKISERN